MSVPGGADAQMDAALLPNPDDDLPPDDAEEGAGGPPPPASPAARDAPVAAPAAIPRLLDFGRPETRPPFADNRATTSRYSLLSFLPVVRASGEHGVDRDGETRDFRRKTVAASAA